MGVDEANVVAVTNGGGIRAAIAAGDITKADVNTVLPFGNTVAYVTVTGEVLLEALEASTYCTPESVGAFPQVSGIEFTVDTNKAYDQGDLYPSSTYYGPASIQRVSITSVNGKAFDPEATYVSSPTTSWPPAATPITPSPSPTALTPAPLSTSSSWTTSPRSWAALSPPSSTARPRAASPS